MSQAGGRFLMACPWLIQYFLPSIQIIYESWYQMCRKQDGGEKWYIPWQKSKFHMKTTVWDDGPETRLSAERQMLLIWFLKDLQFWHNQKLRYALLARSSCRNTAVATLGYTGEWRREGPNAHCPSNHSFVYWVLTLCWSWAVYMNAFILLLVYCIGRGERSVLPGRVHRNIICGVSALKATSELTALVKRLQGIYIPGTAIQGEVSRESS